MRLVLLYGGAAAGKLTTARALSRLVDYPVFHNHLVVDLLTEVFPFGSAPFVRLRESFWLSVFSEAAAAARSLIFTFAPESSVPAGFPDRVRSTVDASGGRVCWVHLLVSAEEQERRIGDSSRLAFHKLTDLQTLRRLREFDADVEHLPLDLEIDTDHSGAETSARAIVDHFHLAPETLTPRYPGT